MRLPRLQLPPTPALIAVLALAFALPGLAGHDPWKSHDALGIGVIWQMALSGDAIVPRIGALAWLADPPLYHWFGAALGWLLQHFSVPPRASRAACSCWPRCGCCTSRRD
jgi:4-amino-4-deoxy-L-arabinose transferase-like glycosyltransferase